MEIRKYNLFEWEAEGERRFGKDKRGWQFVCPSCGYVAKVQEWIDAGASSNQAAFSCVGRWLGSEKEIFNKTGGPCNYAGGGLFQLNPVEVTISIENKRRIFDFAPEVEAKKERLKKRG